jgi:hypothetical protein
MKHQSQSIFRVIRNINTAFAPFQKFFEIIDRVNAPARMLEKLVTFPEIKLCPPFESVNLRNCSKCGASIAATKVAPES